MVSVLVFYGFVFDFRADFCKNKIGNYILRLVYLATEVTEGNRRKAISYQSLELELKIWR